jgi:hypothetical protein
LKFLLEAGLIQNPKITGPLGVYLKNRKQGEGVALPSVSIYSGAAVANRLISVLDAKKILRHLGFYAGPINEERDDAFFQAVVNFQSSQHMVPDGLVGSETLAKLREAWPEFWR